MSIGYASRPEVLEAMLQNMFVGTPPGTDDRLLDFSTAVAGGLFFVPSAATLDELVGSRPADLYSATPVTAARGLRAVQSSDRCPDGA